MLKQYVRPPVGEIQISSASNYLGNSGTVSLWFEPDKSSLAASSGLLGVLSYEVTIGVMINFKATLTIPSPSQSEDTYRPVYKKQNLQRKENLEPHYQEALKRGLEELYKNI